MGVNLKHVILVIFTCAFFLTSFSTPVHSDKSPFLPLGLESRPYKQEIMIPIDTSLEEAKCQPIDMKIPFDHSCWAVNETLHSIRVAYEDGSELQELESQIYNLSHTDENHITSCNIVFLIPREASGEETYYVFYSDSPTDPPNYADHVFVEDTHYFYEPISGQIIDFDYYKITQDNYIIYGICQKGELLGNGMSNSVIKLKPNSTVFETVNAEQIASFSMSYSTNPVGATLGSQWAADVSKSVLIDGNLMIQVRIKGISPEGEIQTDNIYTYYYQPTGKKTLNVNVHHEVLQTCHVKGNKEREGTYATLSTIKARSATIEKMNLGNILPYIHFHGEGDIIKEYTLPTDPTADPAEWILSAKDDEDLGTNAWMCIDDPTTGIAHGLIFESNTGFLEGENDGIQVKSSVHQHVKLPGLEADSGDLFAMKNAYENGQHDTELTAGTNVLFNVEFVTFQTGGYQAVEQEANLYQKLIPLRPISRENVTTTEKKTQRYTLTTFVHFAPSVPLGSMLSAATGKNLTYLTAELFKNNGLVSSGSAGRLQLGNMDIEFENTTFIEKIKMVLGIFDLKNSSFFKKVRFPDLEEGVYLVKIYKENPLFGQNRRYIGFTIVNITENTTSHVYCKPEGTFEASIIDQEEQGIQNVQFLLLHQGVIIADETSDANGSIILHAPCYSRIPYTLQAYYQGFLIAEQEVSLRMKHHFFPIKETFELSLYTLDLTVKDALGLPPAININPMITSEDMSHPLSLPAEELGNGCYCFSKLYPAAYQVTLGYKSFTIEETVTVKQDTTRELTFPAEFFLNMTILNNVGMPVERGKITLHRDGKTISTALKQGNAQVLIPPGTYELHVTSKDDKIASQLINLRGKQTLALVTSQGSTLHATLVFLGSALAAAAVIVLLWKRRFHLGLHLLTVGLLIIALSSPWWLLSGSDSNVSTSTITMLFPANIITFTTSGSDIGGEISSVPEEFTMVLELLTLFLLLTSVFAVISGILKPRFHRTAVILSIIGVIFLLITLGLFFFAMSEVTKVGVGSLSGSGELNVSIPGKSEQVLLPCAWGLGTGFYLTVLAFISLVLLHLKTVLFKV